MIDTLSFVAGMVTTIVVGWIGYHIIRITEERIKEEQQWEHHITSQPSASETYWGEQLRNQTSTEDERSVVIRPPS